MSRIAVAVVNFNTRECLRDCLRAVMQAGLSELVVVDNASTDGSREMVRTEFPQVLLHVNERNTGYGAGANQAVKHCAAPYVLLLNADTMPQPQALSVLESYLDRHPRVGVCGPLLLDPDGGTQLSCFPFPTPLNVFLELTDISRLPRRLPLIGKSSRHVGRAHAVPWIKGAALALRRTAFDAVGGFDESFFMYSEEIDLCYRLRLHGWQTHFVPDARIVHAGAASTLQCRVPMAVRALTSTIDFYGRHYSHRQLVELKLILATTMIAKILRDGLRFGGTRDQAKRRRLAEDLRIWVRVIGASAGRPQAESINIQPDHPEQRFSGSLVETP
ncbi:MAG TPA: glycosyltransferase family 2 protein [Chloroflexota bacterium]